MHQRERGDVDSVDAANVDDPSARVEPGTRERMHAAVLARIVPRRHRVELVQRQLVFAGDDAKVGVGRAVPECADLAAQRAAARDDISSWASSSKATRPQWQLPVCVLLLDMVIQVSIRRTPIGVLANPRIASCSVHRRAAPTHDRREAGRLHLGAAGDHEQQRLTGRDQLLAAVRFGVQLAGREYLGLPRLDHPRSRNEAMADRWTQAVDGVV